MDAFLQGILSLDRRWIYLVLVIVFVFSLIKGRMTNPVVLPPVRQLYTAVEAAPANPGQQKIILVGLDYEAGSLGENGNQTRALLRHLMLSHKRFAIFSITPQGAANGQMMTSDIAGQYGYEYGKDWIDFGYKLPMLSFYKTLIHDIPKAIGQDGRDGRVLTPQNFPIMNGIKSMKDVAMHVEITTYATLDDWISIVQPATKPRLKMGYACTGINVTGAYPYLDSGQLVGLMPGLKGAADYEKLVDAQENALYRAGKIKARFDPYAPAQFRLPAPARKLMYTQNAAHLVVLFFILIGNIGLLISLRIRNKKGGA